jgi:pimeloyl-[acyl-carrier protein] synthase
MSESPVQFDVDISTVGILGNRFLAELSTLRETDPVHWSPASRCWLITRHADVTEALSGTLPLSNKRLVDIGLGAIAPADRARLFPTIMQYMPNWIIDVDPPDHTRLRKLLVKAFSKKVVERVRPFVRERVNTLLSDLARHPEVEFNEQIARQLPGSVILKLTGLSQDYLPRLRKWSNAFGEGIGAPYASIDALKRADEAMAEMNVILVDEISKRRDNPQDDLLSELMRAAEDGETLTRDEMLGALHVLIIAGHDTTSSTITLGLEALARQPDIWEYLYRNPDQSHDTCLELMRYIAMSTSQPRLASADFEWHGQLIKRGDIVFLMLAAANRDPRAFVRPEQIDPQRNLEHSLVFAPGLHHCIGHLLAKMQVTEFFSSLVQQFEGAEILDKTLQFLPQVAFRGLHALNVRMKPRNNAETGD